MNVKENGKEKRMRREERGEKREVRGEFCLYEEVRRAKKRWAEGKQGQEVEGMEKQKKKKTTKTKIWVFISPITPQILGVHHQPGQTFI